MVLRNKISVFGDSIGKGVITCGNEKNVSEKCAVKLFEKKFNTRIDNRSRFGQTLAKTYRRGEFDNFIKTIDKGDETVVVLELGNNDCAYFWENVATSPDKAHDPITPLAEFIDLYEKTLKKLSDSGVKVVCCNLVPIDSGRYFNNVIGKICDKTKVLEFLRGDWTTIYRHHEMFSNAIFEVSRRYDVPMIDLRKPFLDSLEFSSLFCEDGIHPNERGQRMIFDSVAAFTEKYVG